jgi:DNA-binding CsgD family transcriptional regulator
MGASHLREGDAALMLQVVEEGRWDDTAEPVPRTLLEGLQRLIPCDEHVSFQHHDYRRRATLLIQGADEDGAHYTLEGAALAGDDVGAEIFWEYFWEDNCSYPQRTGDLRTVINSADFFPTERARLANPYREVCPDVRYFLQVSLPAPPGEARRFEFMRGDGPPFSERDRQVMTLLRPHLLEICTEAERRRKGVPRLSPREWEVLGMASVGLSYAEIARVLFVSTATVRKHMEHVRERLGVHSVAAAVAVAMPHAPAVPGPVRNGHRRDRQP